MSRHAVWVTGVGAECAAGSGVGPLAAALEAGAACLRSEPGLGAASVGRAPDPPGDRRTRRLDRSAALFLAAAEEAWASAGLDDGALDPARLAVIEGSSLGPVAAALAARAAPRSPALLVTLLPGAGGAAFAARHGVAGPVFHLSAGSVSATCALGEGFERVASGAADVVVAGGAECPLHPEVIEVFDAAGILARDAGGDGAACLPFDARRSGTLLGEGAGALILESELHARRRGAAPRAVLAGYGLATEAGSMVAPDPNGSGVVAAIRRALGEAAPRTIDWIKAHGTGTRRNDAAECIALAAVFGAALPDRPLTSLKPMLGHCLGASGVVEAVAAVLALERCLVPRTCGTAHVDPALPPCRVATAVERRAGGNVLLLSESFGGRCAALVMGRG